MRTPIAVYAFLERSVLNLGLKIGKIKVKYLLTVLAAVLFAALYCISEYSVLEKEETSQIYRKQDGELCVYYIDVGQGDSQVIISPDGYAMLIDAGTDESEKELLNFIKEIGINTFEYAVMTHPHSDHIGGADLILNSIKCKNVIITDVIDENSDSVKMFEAIENNNIETIIAKMGSTYTLGNECTFDILSPDKTLCEDDNNYCIVLRLCHKENVFMFQGDSEIKAENKILEHFSANFLKADVLKVGHHGSSSATSEQYLNAVSPSISVISVGLDNDYGHPKESVLDKLSEYSYVYRTDVLGTIAVTSDGSSVKVHINANR